MASPTSYRSMAMATARRWPDATRCAWRSGFAGPDGGTDHWAIRASQVATCKLNAIDPKACLADVINRIVRPSLQPHRRPHSIGLSGTAGPHQVA